MSLNFKFCIHMKLKTLQNLFKNWKFPRKIVKIFFGKKSSLIILSHNKTILFSNYFLKYLHVLKTALFYCNIVHTIKKKTQSNAFLDIKIYWGEGHILYTLFINSRSINACFLFLFWRGFLSKGLWIYDVIFIIKFFISEQLIRRKFVFKNKFYSTHDKCLNYYDSIFAMMLLHRKSFLLWRNLLNKYLELKKKFNNRNDKLSVGDSLKIDFYLLIVAYMSCT